MFPCRSRCCAFSPNTQHPIDHAHSFRIPDVVDSGEEATRFYSPLHGMTPLLMFTCVFFLQQAAFCVIVAIKRKSLADDDEDSDSLKKGDSSASAPQPTVVHGGQASQPSMGGPGVAPKSQV